MQVRKKLFLLALCYALFWFLNNTIYYDRPAYQQHPSKLLDLLAPADTTRPPVVPILQPRAVVVQVPPLKGRPDRLPLGTLRATVYHATAAQCDGNPLETADGSRIVAARIPRLRWCAVSQDLLTRRGGPLNFGDTLCVREGGRLNGRWVVRDVMNYRHRRHIDFLVRPADKFDPDQNTVEVHRIWKQYPPSKT